MTYRERKYLEDDIHCHNKQKADIRFQDGRLPHIKGACCYQVIRASKNPNLSPEGRGFTYNHAGMLCYFHHHFFYEYLTGPKGEHEAPSLVYLCISKDGIHWGKPFEVFPAIKVSSKPYRGPKREYIKSEQIDAIVHHRMGFYTSSKGKLLISTFYGLSPDFHTAPNNGYGVGRVVREIYPDMRMSDIYFLRYNEPGGYNRNNTDNFRYYEESADEGFKRACDELLADKLVVQQWWEEERLDTEYFSRPGGRALSYYTLPNGRVMGVFKDSFTSYSDDRGRNWSELKKSWSMETASGKVWGQKTNDGKYALVYNPVPDGAHRWPLAMQISENGVDFDHLMAIVPEISPCRYEGRLKNLGAQYVRGITEANQQPDEQAMWLVYSVNKEDMWISRIPLPAGSEETEDVSDTMSLMSDEELRRCWNLYVPSWNGVELREASDGSRGLQIRDCDPYDRTRVMRLFRPGVLVRAALKIRPIAVHTNGVRIEIQDVTGQTVANFVLRENHKVYFRNAGSDVELCQWKENTDLYLEFTVDCVENKLDIIACCEKNEKRLSSMSAASVDKVERLVIASKYDLPWQGLEVHGKGGNIGNLPGADEKQLRTEFYIMEVKICTIET
ncbi:MAG: hypothetical protein KHY46_09745 [Clostridiales bacterium]|nr:hypothetical protein [Clostridiales bacterium]